MAEKTLNTRIVHRHDSESKWAATSFIPRKAELIVYDADENTSYERIKIGDGVTNVTELPFIADEALAESKQYTDTAIADLVNSAPETLDTLGELAAAFQENEEVVDVLNQAITTKYSADNPPPVSCNLS